MSQKKKNKVSKYYYQLILTIIGMFTTYIVLDMVINYQVGNPFFSINLFSISWITILISFILFLTKKLRIIVFTLSSLIINFITYSQYVYFLKYEDCYPLSQLLTNKVLNCLTNCDVLIVTVILISIIMTVITIFGLSKIPKLLKTKIDYLLVILIIIILAGTTRLIKYLSLGPEVTYSSQKIATEPKNIYLNNNFDSSKIKVIGMYEFIFQNIRFDINNQIKENYNQVIENYK